MTIKRNGLSKATFDDDYNGMITAHLLTSYNKRGGYSYVSDARLPGFGYIMAQYDRDKQGIRRTLHTDFSKTIPGESKEERKQWLINNGFLRE